MTIAKQSEDELAAVTKQRDGIEAKLRTELRGHPDSELWGDAGLIKATMRCVDALDKAIEQRDEWKAKYIQQNKDLGCEMMDTNGTIWDYAKKVQLKLTAMTEQQDGLRSGIDYASDQLSKVTEQRDRLAEALEHSMKHMRHSLNCPARVLWNPHPCNCQMEWAYNNAIEALQSLTPNEL